MLDTPSRRLENASPRAPARHRPGAETSAAAQWRPLRRFIVAERAIGTRMARGRATAAFYEFIRFGMKQGWACLFGGVMVALLLGSHFFYPQGAWLARYDFLLLAAIGVQIALLAFRLETPAEAAVILVYHVTGTAMEIFKTSAGSWIYPEPNMLRIMGVPLFTGFMYAAVGSYLFRVWRLFDFHFTRHPPLWALALLSMAVYANFFAHHYMADMRYLLLAATAVLFGRSTVHYWPWRERRQMPLLLGFGLVALFIWFAENIGTFSRIWLYPHQLAGWSAVGLPKLGSWFLLMIISYTLVAAFNRPADLRDRRA